MKRTTKRRCLKGDECGMSCINKNKTCNKPIDGKLSDDLDILASKIQENVKSASQPAQNTTKKPAIDAPLGQGDRSNSKQSIKALVEDLRSILPTETKALVLGFMKRHGVDIEMPPEAKERGNFTSKEIRGLIDDIKTRNESNMPSKEDRLEKTKRILAKVNKMYKDQNLSLTEKLAKFYGFNHDELNKAKLSLSDHVALFNYVGPTTGHGFTFANSKHVAVTRMPNVEKQSGASKLEQKKAEELLDKKINTDKWFSTTTTIENSTNKRIGKAVTFIHELGHRVDYNQKNLYDPKNHSVITKGYAASNKQESFAENFALWAMHPNYYKKKNPRGAALFENLVKQ